MKPKYKVGQFIIVDGEEEEILESKFWSQYDKILYRIPDRPGTKNHWVSELAIKGPVYKAGDRVRIKTHEELLATDGVAVNGHWYSIEKEYLNHPKSASIHGVNDKNLGTEQEVEDISTTGSLIIGTNLYGQWMISKWLGTETSAPCPQCSKLVFRSSTGAIACVHCSRTFEPLNYATKPNKKDTEMQEPKYKKGDVVLIKQWDEIKDHEVFRTNLDQFKDQLKEDSGKSVELMGGGFSGDGIERYTYLCTRGWSLREDFIQGLASDSKTQEGWYFSTLKKKLAHGDGRDIEPGVTHSVDGDIEACINGLHMFPTLANHNISGHSPYSCVQTDLILWRVEGSGNFDEDGCKTAYRNRKYLWGVHVFGWNMGDYRSLNDCRSIADVKERFPNEDVLTTYESKQTETIEVPYIEGYKCVGYRKPVEGDWFLSMITDTIKQAPEGFDSKGRIIYEKLALPKPEVKRGQVWKSTNQEYPEVVLVCNICGKHTLLDLMSTGGNDVWQNYDDFEGLVVELYEKVGCIDYGFELVAQTLEEYYAKS